MRTDRIRWRYIQAALNEYWRNVDRATAANPAESNRAIALVERSFDAAVRTSILSNPERALLCGAIHDGERRVCRTADEGYIDDHWRRPALTSPGR